MTYKREELTLKDDSLEEQIRTRDIFENLKDRVTKGEKLSEHEKDFFCQGVKLSHFDDGKIEDYDCCSNYKFKITYLAYVHDLLGFSSYQKVKDTSLYHPDRKEIDKDINYLQKVASDWQKVINTSNHNDELLQQVSKETRVDLEAIEKSKGRLLFSRDKLKYILDKRATLLQSKYIYCMALQIFEMFDKKEFILNLNGEEIEITEFSIIHILNRHFAKITKPNSAKSFHIEDFDPKYLNKQLKFIFDEIDNSGFLQGKMINKIAFRYEGVDYLIWVNKRKKQVKGKGNIEFNRLETFYPVVELKDINDLNSNYELKGIKENLSIYVKK